MQLNIIRTDVTPSRSWTRLPLALKKCAELMTVLQVPGSKAAGIKFLTDLYMLYMTSPPKTSISVKSHDTVGARPELSQPVQTLLLRCIWVAGLRDPDNEQAVVYFYQHAFTATLRSCTALCEAAWPIQEPEAGDALKELCMFCNILGKCSERVTEGSTPSCHPLDSASACALPLLPAPHYSYSLGHTCCPTLSGCCPYVTFLLGSDIACGASVCPGQKCHWRHVAAVACHEHMWGKAGFVGSPPPQGVAPVLRVLLYRQLESLLHAAQALKEGQQATIRKKRQQLACRSSEVAHTATETTARLCDMQVKVQTLRDVVCKLPVRSHSWMPADMTPRLL